MARWLEWIWYCWRHRHDWYVKSRGPLADVHACRVCGALGPMAPPRDQWDFLSTSMRTPGPVFMAKGAGYNRTEVSVHREKRPVPLADEVRAAPDDALRTQGGLRQGEITEVRRITPLVDEPKK